MGAALTLDGYIADINGDVGPLFDWCSDGAVVWKFTEKQEHPSRTTKTSADFIQTVCPQIGAGGDRALFDHATLYGAGVVVGA